MSSAGAQSQRARAQYLLVSACLPRCIPTCYNKSSTCLLPSSETFVPKSDASTSLRRRAPGQRKIPSRNTGLRSSPYVPCRPRAFHQYSDSVFLSTQKSDSFFTCFFFIILFISYQLLIQFSQSNLMNGTSDIKSSNKSE